MLRRSRRSFLGLIGSVGAWPLTARARTVRTVGVLALGTPPLEPFLVALREGLREVGYSEDRNLRLDVRSADGKATQLAPLAAELVRLKVDVIVAYQTPSGIAAKQATSAIPIVFSSVGDPLGTKLIDSFARPGGNVTGSSAGSVEIAGKSVELIRELLPDMQRLAVLANETDPFTKGYIEAISEASRRTGLQLEPVMRRPADPLEPAFDRIAAAGAGAVIVQGSLVRKEAADLALRRRLPSISTPSVWTQLGGLLTYSAHFGALMKETAAYVGKVLDGSKPGALPVVFPTRFDLTINLKTAKALGLQIPLTLLRRADEVIE